MYSRLAIIIFIPIISTLSSIKKLDGLLLEAADIG